MRTIARTIVSAILVSKDNKILLGKQREGGVYPDCWHIPGGGVDASETKREALIREIREEVGLDITTAPTVLVSDTDSGIAVKTDKVTGESYQVDMQFNTFRVDLPQNADSLRVSLNDDLTQYQWVDIKDLKNYKHTPPSQKLFTTLGYL